MYELSDEIVKKTIVVSILPWGGGGLQYLNILAKICNGRGISPSPFTPFLKIKMTSIYFEYL